MNRDQVLEIIDEVTRRICTVCPPEILPAVIKAAESVKVKYRQKAKKIGLDRAHVLLDAQHPGCPHTGRNPGVPHPEGPCPFDCPDGVNVWINHCRGVVTIPSPDGLVRPDPFGRIFGIGKP